jgi:Zn-dependent protease with chaperone function
MQPAIDHKGQSQDCGAIPTLRQRPSIASRVILALALMVGFYVLAIGIAVGLIGLVYAVGITGTISLRLAFFALAGAFIILLSIIPRPDRFTAPGPRLDGQSQPQLLGVIAGVAESTGQEMPAEVYLVPDVNAWVAQRGGFMGFGGRKVMGIGLGLLQALTVSQLRGVVAHEFGHYYGGDTRLGPLIYRTREAIWRSLSNLSGHSALIQKPFTWYAKFFLRVTHAVSRRQEFVADELAAHVVGARAMAESLRATHANAMAFSSYWENEVVPVLGAGHRPPIAAGFKQFVSASTIAKAMRESMEIELKEGVTDPYDTHPSLPERLAALESLPPGEMPTDDPPAIALLNSVARLEVEMLAAMAGAEKIEAMQPIAWEAVGAQALLPRWEEIVSEHRPVLKGITPKALPEVTRDLSEFGTMLVGPDEVPPDDPDVLREASIGVLGAALLVALHTRGWRVSALPGEAVACERDRSRIEPFKVVEQMASNQLGTAAWRQTCEAEGIARFDLGAETQPMG